MASIAIAKATGWRWVREVFTEAYEGDVGLWDTHCGETLRYRKYIDASHVRVLFNISAESATALQPRRLADIVKSVSQTSVSDALSVSGTMTGVEVGPADLVQVRDAVPHMIVTANAGTRADSVAEKLSLADGVVVGTGLRAGGITWDPVDVERV